MTEPDRVATEPDQAPARRNPLDKAFRLLALLVDRAPEGYGIREMARASGLTPATVHRVMTELVELDVTRAIGADGKYEVSLEMLRLARKLVDRYSTAEMVLPALGELTSATRETSYLAVLNRGRASYMFVESVSSDQELRYLVPLHEWVQLDASASALAILSALSESEAEQTLRDTIEDSDELKKMLSLSVRARRDGVAITRGTRVAGAVGISAPVREAGGLVVGSIGVTVPEGRASKAQLQMLTEAVRLASARLDRQAWWSQR